jgi:hypothetical protein
MEEPELPEAYNQEILPHMGDVQRKMMEAESRLQIPVAVPFAHGLEFPKVPAERSRFRSFFLQLEGNST